jgi:ribosomal protein L22
MTAAADEKDPKADAKDEAPAKPAAKKAAAKKPAAEKPAAAKEPAAEQGPSAKEAAAKEPAAKKAAAVKAAASKEPVAEKGSSAREPAEKKAPAAKEPVAKGPVAKEPAEEKAPDAKKAPAAKAPAAAKECKQPEQKPAKRAGKRAEPKPRRRVVRAQARYVRTSARKARMVCGHLRGKSIPEARAILEFTPREVARDWSKLLESAVANAESNHELLEDDLIVREAYADEGPTIKRFRPRAMGRATPIRKRTSHLTITLTPDA